jgi:AcrR family transcriptional regulator
MTTQTTGAATRGRSPTPTRDRLLDTAGALLAEVGMERISTNMICQQAGVTPPALYYYFADKYAVVAALGERLMERQNEVLMQWLARHAGGDIAVYADHVGDLLRATAEVTEAEPGGVWIERALHSTPHLEHVRLDSHRFVTDRLTDAYVPLLPKRTREQIWRRVRMMVEFGYVTVEMLHAETGVPRDKVIAETTRMLRLATLDLSD